MRNQPQTWPEEARPPRPHRRKTVVIADDGADVALVLFDASEATTTGTRFSHGGKVWVIRGTRHGSRVLVAEPAGEPRH